MKLLLAVPAITLLSLGFSACGGASKGTSLVSQSPSNATAGTAPAITASSAASTKRTPREDRDKDYESHTSNSYYDYDDYNTPNYPHAASAADKRAVTAVVKRYFAAAVADDGATACSLIYSLFAETIPEILGQPPTGVPALRGKTCAEVMWKLFKMNHGQLVTELATLEVTSVRVNGMRGLALLSFKTIPARSIQVHLERGVWKIGETLDVAVS